MDYGIRVVIAPSFADIFSSNCFKNGILPIVFSAETVDELFTAVAAEPGYSLAVDLDQQQVLTPDRLVLRFEIDQFRKQCMLHGLDDIDLTLQFADHIRVYEERRRKSAPWLFTVV